MTVVTNLGVCEAELRDWGSEYHLDRGDSHFPAQGVEVHKGHEKGDEKEREEEEEEDQEDP